MSIVDDILGAAALFAPDDEPIVACRVHHETIAHLPHVPWTTDAGGVIEVLLDETVRVGDVVPMTRRQLEAWRERST